MRRAGHVACIGERRGTYGALVGKPEGDYLEDLGIGGKIILKQILRKSIGTAGIGLIWLGKRTNGGLL